MFLALIRKQETQKQNRKRFEIRNYCRFCCNIIGV